MFSRIKCFFTGHQFVDKTSDLYRKNHKETLITCAKCDVYIFANIPDYIDCIFYRGSDHTSKPEDKK